MNVMKREVIIEESGESCATFLFADEVPLKNKGEEKVMSNEKGFTLVELMFVVLILGSIAFFGIGAWTDSNMDFWLTHFKGEPVNFPFIWSGVLSVILNVFAIVGNIIAEVAKVFV